MEAYHRETLTHRSHGLHRRVGLPFATQQVTQLQVRSDAISERPLHTVSTAAGLDTGPSMIDKQSAQAWVARDALSLAAVRSEPHVCLAPIASAAPEPPASRRALPPPPPARSQPARQTYKTPVRTSIASARAMGVLHAESSAEFVHRQDDGSRSPAAWRLRCWRRARFAAPAPPWCA